MILLKICIEELVMLCWNGKRFLWKKIMLIYCSAFLVDAVKKKWVWAQQNWKKTRTILLYYILNFEFKYNLRFQELLKFIISFIISFFFLYRINALTTKFNDKPEEASRPFDKHRSGFVLADGAAILLLEVTCLMVQTF